MRSIIPRRQNWKPPFKHATSLLIVLALCVGLIWADVFISAIWSRAYVDQHGSNGTGYGNRAPIRWTDPVDCDNGMIFFLLLPISIETVHFSIHVLLYHTGYLHVVAALVLSICMGCAWMQFGMWTILVEMCAETTFPSTWKLLSDLRIGMCFVMTVMWWIYMGFAAAEVHRWRKEKKQSRRVRTLVDEEGVELGAVKQ